MRWDNLRRGGDGQPALIERGAVERTIDTPEFRGITDKLSISQWENPPFPYDPKRVKPIDDQYWKRYRATPKAYVTLATGQRLWARRFGHGPEKG